MKRRGIAYRRKQYERIREKRLRDIPWLREVSEQVDNPAFIERFVDTPAPCSCVLCGNPRRHFGKKTRQERIADERERQQLEAVGIR